MPFLTPDIADEADGLATFAGQQVRQLATTLYGLTPDQLFATPTVSSLSLKQLALQTIAVVHNVSSWMGAKDPQPVGEIVESSEYSPDGALEPRAVFEWSESANEDLPDRLIQAFNITSDFAESMIRAADLDQPADKMPDEPWLTGEENWNNRWCALHLIAELARHAGHADTLRESIDGKFAYQLNAVYDGLSWPPDWVK